MDQEQRKFLTRRTADVLATSPMRESLSILNDSLLAVGGEFVVLPMIEEDVAPPC